MSALDGVVDPLNLPVPSGPAPGAPTPPPPAMLTVRPGELLVLRYERALTANEAKGICATVEPLLPAGATVLVLDNGPKVTVDAKVAPPNTDGAFTSDGLMRVYVAGHGTTFHAGCGGTVLRGTDSAGEFYECSQHHKSPAVDYIGNDKTYPDVTP